MKLNTTIVSTTSEPSINVTATIPSGTTTSPTRTSSIVTIAIIVLTVCQFVLVIVLGIIYWLKTKKVSTRVPLVNNQENSTLVVSVDSDIGNGETIANTENHLSQQDQPTLLTETSNNHSSDNSKSTTIDTVQVKPQ